MIITLPSSSQVHVQGKGDLCAYQTAVELLDWAADPEECALVERRPPAHLDLDRRLGRVLLVVLPEVRPDDALPLRFPSLAKAVCDRNGKYGSTKT